MREIPWFKVDDRFHSSRKVKAIPRAQRLEAVGLWAIAGSWSAGEGLDGFVPDYMIDDFGGTAELVAALVASGSWLAVDGGYRFAQWRKFQDGKYRPNIPPRIRAAVMARDGYRCVICGSTENLSLDHIVRYRDDGPDTIDNLRVLCMPCNWERG